MLRRHGLTEAQWEAIRNLWPGKATDPGRTAADNRLFVEAVLDVLKTGIPWADLPARFGKPNTVRKRYDRWCVSGVWERVARALGDDDVGEIQLDSTPVKAHPTASPGRREADEKKGRRTTAGASAGVGAD